MRALIILSITIALAAGFLYTLDRYQRPPKPKRPIPVEYGLEEMLKAQKEAEEETIKPADDIKKETTDKLSNQTLMTIEEKLKLAPPAEPIIDINKKYAAVLKTTEGDIVIALNAAGTPNTVNNFVYLSGKHFYDNTIFHRVMPGFMIQGGDPRGDGMGGPAYRFADEKFEGKYTRGTVAMANAGPNTNGSQFFIMHADYNLPPNYVIFGQVIKGMDVVDKIATAKTQPGGEGSTPVNPVEIKSVEIVEE